MVLKIIASDVISLLPCKLQKESIIYQKGESPQSYGSSAGRINKWEQEKYCNLLRALTARLVSTPLLNTGHGWGWEERREKRMRESVEGDELVSQSI